MCLHLTLSPTAHPIQHHPHNHCRRRNLPTTTTTTTTTYVFTSNPLSHSTPNPTPPAQSLPPPQSPDDTNTNNNNNNNNQPTPLTTLTPFATLPPTPTPLFGPVPTPRVIATNADGNNVGVGASESAGDGTTLLLAILLPLAYVRLFMCDFAKIVVFNRFLVELQLLFVSWCGGVDILDETRQGRQLLRRGRHRATCDQ
jgi:hypothetical protein